MKARTKRKYLGKEAIRRQIRQDKRHKITGDYRRRLSPADMATCRRDTAIMNSIIKRNGRNEYVTLYPWGCGCCWTSTRPIQDFVSATKIVPCPPKPHPMAAERARLDAALERLAVFSK